jgi:hypothetical protein
MIVSLPRRYQTDAPLRRPGLLVSSHAIRPWGIAGSSAGSRLAVATVLASYQAWAVEIPFILRA